MKSSHPKTKTPTKGIKHDVTTPKTPPIRPTERALHPSTSLELMVSRAMDQELDWYFSYAESALHRDRVGMLPSYAAMLVTDATEGAIRNRAQEMVRVVRGCLRTMKPRHAEVLRAVYTPRAWPKSVEKAFDSLSAIVVRLAFAADPWPERSPHAGLEHAAAARLASAIAADAVSVPKLRQQAERMLGGAILAYARLRALESNTLGVR